MPIKTVGYQVKRLYRITSLAFKEAVMHPNALYQHKVISFYKTHGQHGLKATLEAFNIKRRTLFQWQKPAHAEDEGALRGV